MVRRHISCEVRISSTHKKQSYSLKRAWCYIGVFPVRYEHHLHIKSKAIPVNRAWWYIGVFPVRYEYHLHVKSKATPVRGHGGT
jgi:hypothetical protein